MPVPECRRFLGDVGLEVVGGRVRTTPVLDEASHLGSVATVNVSIDHGDAVVRTNAPRAGLQLIVVTTEDGVVTKIERGENRGLTITNDSIARKLTRIPNVNAGATTHKVATELQRGTVVAMLQDPSTLRIVAASAARITASSRP